MSGLVGQSENIHQPLLKSKATLKNNPERFSSFSSKQVISESGSTLDSYDSPLCSYYAGYSIPYSHRNKESIPSIDPSAMTLNSDQTQISSISTTISATYSKINQVLQDQKQFYLPCKQQPQNQAQQEQSWNPDSSKDKAAINFSSYMLKLVENIKKRKIKPRILFSKPQNIDSTKAISAEKQKEIGYSSDESDDSDNDEHSIWDDSKAISLGFDCDQFLNRHNNPLTLFQLYRMRSELYQNIAIERKIIIDEVHTICQHYKQPVSSQDLTWQDEYLQLNYFSQKSQNQKQKEQAKPANNPMQSLSTPRVSPHTYSFFNPQQQNPPKTTRESTQNCKQEQTVSQNLAQKILLQLQKKELQTTNTHSFYKQEPILTRQSSSKSAKTIARLTQEQNLDEKNPSLTLNSAKQNQISKMMMSLQAISSISSQEAPRHQKNISTNASNSGTRAEEKEELLSSSKTLMHLQKLNRSLEERCFSCELIEKPFSIFQKKSKGVQSINGFLQKKSQMTPKKPISSSQYSQANQYSFRSSSALPNSQHSLIVTTPQKRTEMLNDSQVNLSKQQSFSSRTTKLPDKSKQQFLLSSASQKLRFSPAKGGMNRNQSFKKPVSCQMLSPFADKSSSEFPK